MSARMLRNKVLATWRLAHRCWLCDYPVWWHHDGTGGDRYLWPHEFEPVGLWRAVRSWPWRDL